MSNATLGLPPFQTPFLGSNNQISPVWQIWLRSLYVQTGGSSSTSLTSLIESVDALSTEVADFSATITALQNEINGLSVGRQL